MRTIRFRLIDKSTHDTVCELPLRDIVFEGGDIENMYACRFTDLIDIDGRLIYEGDILKDSLGQLLKVEWIAPSFRLLSKDSFGYWNNERDFVDARQMKVVGNIYQNPELLI